MLAQGAAAEYRGAQPFPHIAIDDFVPDWVIDKLLEEFPAPGQIEWDLYTDGGNTQKLATRDELRMGPFTRQFIGQLNGSAFITFLEGLTGIDGLLPDPHLEGGGLHQIERGGFLKVHADFNVHQRLRLDRRLNLLLYLNRGWHEEYGGHLELWNRDMSACARKILPVANRCVVFSTTDTSFHSHPQPLQTPAGVTRKSLALYYYSNGRPMSEQSPSHTTLYQGAEPPGLRSSLRHLALRASPPIFVDAVKRLRRGQKTP